MYAIRSYYANGTVTDIDGKYTVSVDQGSIIQFSFIGFLSQEFVANTGTIDVKLNMNNVFIIPSFTG